MRLIGTGEKYSQRYSFGDEFAIFFGVQATIFHGVVVNHGFDGGSALGNGRFAHGTGTGSADFTLLFLAFGIGCDPFADLRGDITYLFGPLVAFTFGGVSDSHIFAFFHLHNNAIGLIFLHFMNVI